MTTNNRSTGRKRCEDSNCSDERCSKGRIHDANKQGRGTYTMLFGVEGA